MERFPTAAGRWLGTGAERSTRGRAVALIVLLPALLMFTVVAVRGPLPGDTEEPPPPAAPGDDRTSLLVVAVLLAVALAVMAVAVWAQLRRHATPVGATADRAVWRRGGIGRPRWRAVLLIVGLLVGYLLLISTVARLIGPLGLEPQVAEPATTPPPGAPEPAPPPADGLDWWPYLYAASAVFLLLIVVGSVAAARQRNRMPGWLRGRPPSPPAGQSAVPTPGGTPESLARAAAVGLAEIGDPNRAPRAAIIACYLAMEAELARMPEAAPQHFDTASEVLARAVEHHALHAGTATPLVELFGEARFSRHVMREEHRQAAVRALQQVLDELRGPVCAG